METVREIMVLAAKNNIVCRQMMLKGKPTGRLIVGAAGARMGFVVKPADALTLFGLGDRMYAHGMRMAYPLRKFRTK